MTPPLRSKTRPADSGPGSFTAAPRWVKVAAAVALVVALLLGALVLLDGGEHGPARHSPSGQGRRQHVPAGLVEAGVASGHTPPAGSHG